MDQELIAVMGLISLGALVASLRLLRRFPEMRHEWLMRTTPDESAGMAARRERIAEANRVMAKLLAESKQPILPSARPDRVITPH